MSDDGGSNSGSKRRRRKKKKRSARNSPAKQARREVKALHVEQTVRKLIEHREKLVEELRAASEEGDRDRRQEDSAASLTFVETFDALADRLREATLRVGWLPPIVFFRFRFFWKKRMYYHQVIY